MGLILSILAGFGVGPEGPREVPKGGPKESVPDAHLTQVSNWPETKGSSRPGGLGVEKRSK